MRAGRLVALALVLTAVTPGQARALPAPPMVTFDATMELCAGIDQWGCAYDVDMFWSDDYWMTQGLYHPTLGPPAASGPVRVRLTAATCAVGACQLGMQGTIGQHPMLRMGAYCGAFEAELEGVLTGAGMDFTFGFSWAVPGGPVDGWAMDTLHPGTRHVTGHLSARSSQTGGDCGITTPTTTIQIRGILAVR